MIRRRRFLTLGGLAAAAVAAPSGAAAFWPRSIQGSLSSAQESPLPFTKPSVEQLRHAGKKAFAFYFPPTGPISLDNRAPEADQWWKWLNPLESGQYPETGGHTRDRPLPRQPLAGDWRLQDFETEIRQAIDMGLDGFIWEQNPVSSNPVFQSFPKMLQAARNVDPGFKIMLSPDLTNGGNPDPATFNQGVLDVMDHPSIYRENGVLPLATFAPERRPVSWWASRLAELQAAGADCKVLPVFNATPLPAFANWADVAMGFSFWGSRWPSGSAGNITRARNAHAVDRIFMSPVHYEDVRPNAGVFREAANSRLMRSSFEAAITGNADWLCLMPWNDYAECWMGPSVNRGFVVSDFTAYYVTWFKLGSPPAIERDALYYFHRSHRHDLTPSHRPPEGETFQPMSWVGHGDAPRDEVELVGFLTEPGTLVITQGSQVTSKEVAAGLVSIQAPLVPGTTPSFQLQRSGDTVLSLRSRTPIVTERTFQDLVYHAGSTRQT